MKTEGVGGRGTLQVMNQEAEPWKERQVGREGHEESRLLGDLGGPARWRWQRLWGNQMKPESILIETAERFVRRVRNRFCDDFCDWETKVV